MFKRLINSLITGNYDYENVDQISKKAKVIFNNIVGYDDLKEVIFRVITNKYNAHLLLIGVAGSAKSVFLLEIQEYFNNPEKVGYIDGSNATGSGIIDYLRSHPQTEILLIDELDKINKKEQTKLLNVMETSTVDVKKSTKMMLKPLKLNNLKVIATSNSTSNLYKPILNRFGKPFYLEPYTEEIFTQICRNILRRYDKSEPIGEYLAKACWHGLNEPYIRTAVNLAKICKNDEKDIDKMVTTMLKYSPKEENKDYD